MSAADTLNAKMKTKTETEKTQSETEELLLPFLRVGTTTPLDRGAHTRYLKRMISNVGRCESLHNSQPWMVYWILHAADLLGVTDELLEGVPALDIARFLSSCFTAEQQGDLLCGGYGGGAEQIPHLATSYAAVCAFCILGRPECFKMIPRGAIERWILSLRLPNGAYRMHTGGEVDVRASYCVSVISTLLQLDRRDEIMDLEAARYVAQCQTYEGGIRPSLESAEAHGGYTQCGVAALLLMKQFDLLDSDNLLRWTVERQMPWEGGFCGRTNKLVDSCYSFWLGSSHVMCLIGEATRKLARNEDLAAEELFLLDYAQLLDLSTLNIESSVQAEMVARSVNLRSRSLSANADAEYDDSSEVSVDELDEVTGDLLFNQRRLQWYVLQCCQNPSGGLMDKPQHPNDNYHTCYSLSGMSIAQNLWYSAHPSHPIVHALEQKLPRSTAPTLANPSNPKSDRLRVTNPIVNVCKDRVLAALRYFGKGRTFF